MHRLVTSCALLIATAAGAQAAATHTPSTKPAKATAQATGPQVAVLETAQGTIVVKLDEKDAPKTTANFKKLVREKFFDGTYFHRVIPGFMIQGGDPNTKDEDPSNDGIGGPGYTVPAEIKLVHVRGAVATARIGDQANPSRASNGSQFFIDVKDQPSLDAGGYTVFGHVISGMDAVDKIVALGSDPSTPRGAAGPNPGKKALVLHATLEPLSKWEKPVEQAAKPAENKTTTAEAKSDSSK
ncbi:MAG: peptidylprolyl isomerase [Candidatus Eisenbacteria bacterium]|uniref:Peptidyl-prolyl cis-trans isomerase n=1 Tax=Eiseniibacteriota bacterium TaxID=2212470 RepID=A0A538UC40_UNCEI|nr:MAG: peptidylprolyl isomerase [Candidatus Eisenbacteria bacterium]